MILISITECDENRNDPAIYTETYENTQYERKKRLLMSCY